MCWVVKVNAFLKSGFCNLKHMDLFFLASNSSSQILPSGLLTATTATISTGTTSTSTSTTVTASAAA